MGFKQNRMVKFKIVRREMEQNDQKVCTQMILSVYFLFLFGYDEIDERKYPYSFGYRFDEKGSP